ncbi:MAG: hypothetical protein GYA34_08770 [Chloroflexi bacterium]|nr:hypothetical protein [Chloroflexota bacterium]
MKFSLMLVPLLVLVFCACTGIQSDISQPILFSTNTQGVVPTNKPSDTPTLPASPVLTASATPTPFPDYFSRSYSLSNIEYVIPLTVRHVTEQSATLFFEISKPSAGLLIVRSIDPQKPLQKEIILPENQTRHMITLDNLLPDNHYQVIILLGERESVYKEAVFNGKAWGVVNFHTASNEKPIKVGVLGDASFGDDATKDLIELMASQNLDFVINTGDIVYEVDRVDLINSYALKFFEPFSLLLHQYPVYTVLGNHDYDAAVEWQGEPFYHYAFPAFADQNFGYPESRIGNQYYAFAYQDIQFLMLDSQVLFGEEGRADQEAWMKERLADTRYRITIPICHVAPFSSSAVHPNDSLPVRYSWTPIFEAGNVPVVFSGHFHHYERLFVNGITYIVTGGGSSTLYAQGSQLPESQIYARRTHFVLMEIFEDQIKIRAISKEGEIIDETSIRLP